MKQLLLAVVITLAFLNAAFAQRMYNGSGHQIGRVDGERYYDGSGHQIGRVDGDRIYDGSGRQLGRIEGERIYNASGTYPTADFQNCLLETGHSLTQNKSWLCGNHFATAATSN